MRPPYDDGLIEGVDAALSARGAPPRFTAASRPAQGPSSVSSSQADVAFFACEKEGLP